MYQALGTKYEWKVCQQQKKTQSYNTTADHQSIFFHRQAYTYSLDTYMRIIGPKHIKNSIHQTRRKCLSNISNIRNNRKIISGKFFVDFVVRKLFWFSIKYLPNKNTRKKTNSSSHITNNISVWKEKLHSKWIAQRVYNPTHYVVGDGHFECLA